MESQKQGNRSLEISHMKIRRNIAFIDAVSCNLKNFLDEGRRWSDQIKPLRRLLTRQTNDKRKLKELEERKKMKKVDQRYKIKGEWKRVNENKMNSTGKKDKIDWQKKQIQNQSFLFSETVSFNRDLLHIQSAHTNQNLKQLPAAATFVDRINVIN